MKSEGGGGGGEGGEVLKSVGEDANDDAMEIVLNIQREAHTGGEGGGGGVGVMTVTETHTEENAQSQSQLLSQTHHTDGSNHNHNHTHTNGNGNGNGTGKDTEKEISKSESEFLNKPQVDDILMQKKEDKKKCVQVVSQDIIPEENTGTEGKTPNDTEIYRNPRETMPVKCKIVDIEAPWTDTEELRRYMIENCITSKSWKRRQKCVNLLCNDDALVQKGSLGKILIDICSAIYLQVQRNNDSFIIYFILFYYLMFCLCFLFLSSVFIFVYFWFFSVFVYIFIYLCICLFTHLFFYSVNLFNDRHHF